MWSFFRGLKLIFFLEEILIRRSFANIIFHFGVIDVISEGVLLISNFWRLGNFLSSPISEIIEFERSSSLRLKKSDFVRSWESLPNWSAAAIRIISLLILCDWVPTRRQRTTTKTNTVQIMIVESLNFRRVGCFSLSLTISEGSCIVSISNKPVFTEISYLDVKKYRLLQFIHYYLCCYNVKTMPKQNCYYNSSK